MYNKTTVNDEKKDNMTISIKDIIKPEIKPIINKDRAKEGNDINNKLNITKDKDRAKEEKYINNKVNIKKVEDIPKDENYKNNEVNIKRDENKPKESENMVKNDSEVSKIMKSDENKNRYLTEKEIKTISDLLHTVKKSDLDAIVDIYSLAQDIYDEVGKANNDSIIDDTINAIADDKPNKSYWYDPLIHNKVRQDMDYHESNQVSTKAKPITDMSSYLNGVLINQDFGKLPYSYPMSKRYSSYMHQPTLPTQGKIPEPYKANKVNALVQPQIMVKPYLLPYPFAYIQHYAYTDHPINKYYTNNPYTQNYYKRQYPPYKHAYNRYQVPNAVLMNPHLNEGVTYSNDDEEQKQIESKDLIRELLVKTKVNKLPDWKTEPLSSQILEEVRSNIGTSKYLKAFPFRRHVKLEKVGKVIKLDELTRERRSAVEEVTRDPNMEKKEEVDEETYIERTT